MSKLVAGYFHLLRVLLGLLLAAMVALVFSNVVLRYFFDSGIGATDELARWMLVWMTFLGAIIGLRERQHLGIDTLLRVLPSLCRRACVLISYLLMLATTALLVIGSWKMTLINLSIVSAGSGLSTGWFYGIGIVFGVSAALILLYDLFRLLSGRMTDDEILGAVAAESH